MEIIRELRNLNMTTKHVMLGKTPSIQYTWHTRTDAVFGGIRHGDIYSAMYDAGITPPRDAAIEGFFDEKNNFYDRYEAYNIAMNNGQMSAVCKTL